jgi:hypothetical protein
MVVVLLLLLLRFDGLTD